MRKKTTENIVKEDVIYPFADVEFAQKWQEWLMYRKEMRFPAYVQRGLKQTWKQLVMDSGNDVVVAMAMIDQSIANAWRGIFKLKNQLAYGQQSEKLTNAGIKDAILGYTQAGK